MDGGLLTGLSAAGVFTVVLIALARTLLLDRSSFVQQKGEIKDLRSEIDHLKTQVARIEGMYDEQRSLKHRAINELTKAQLILTIVQDLYEKCSCSALDPLGDVLDSIALTTATAMTAATEGTS